jgi:hypothetical protein
MPERAWASLAPLMDDRRYVESAVASIKVKAHPDFRLCVTMNTDASVFELPGYIQSRLKPRIDIVAPPWALQEQILRAKCPAVDDQLLNGRVHAAEEAGSRKGRHDSTRDMLSLAQYAQKLKQLGVDTPLARAASRCWRMPLPERHALLTESSFVQTFRNLTGVPSYHYDASSAGLSTSSSHRRGQQWSRWNCPRRSGRRSNGPRAAGRRRWPPSSVCRRPAMGEVMPFVPGRLDLRGLSIGFAGRHRGRAHRRGCRRAGEQRPARPLALGPEFAGPATWLLPRSRCAEHSGGAAVSDLVREAAMASALAALMEQHVSVCGWGLRALVADRRAAAGLDFSGRMSSSRGDAGSRVPASASRPDASSLASIPRWWRRSRERRGSSILRRHAALLQEAAKPDTAARACPSRERATHRSQKSEPLSTWRAPGCMRGTLPRPARVSEQPQLAELVLAASATIGPRYAARLCALATADHRSPPAETLRALTFEVNPRTKGSHKVEAGFCFRGKRLSAEPWFPVPWPILEAPDVVQLAREACNTITRASQTRVLGKRSTGTHIRRTRTPMRNSSGTRCAEPARLIRWTARRCRS